jgi:hypothetical protein
VGRKVLGRKYFLLIELSTLDYSLRGGAIGSGTAQQAGRSLLLFPKRSMGF